ncbi:MAG: trypsin-like peptidase domain-containing protein [Chthoniobacterales bacterium]|nr:trypsin-like peptidase domain-containing protein [Chthoniobacterales bacterium]
MKNLLKFLLLVLVLSAGVSLLYDYQLHHGHLSLTTRAQPEKYTLADGPAVDSKSVASLASLSEERRKLVAGVIPSVVSVKTTKRLQRRQDGLDPFDFFRGNFRQYRGPDDEAMVQNSLGSGVIVTKEGHIITNNHVVDQVDEIEVQLSDGRTRKARLIGADAKLDLAVLKMDEPGVKPLKLGDSDAVQAGDFVLAVGNPFGFEETVTDGIISSKGRPNRVDGFGDFLQTNAAINPGNSGGPLINLRGEVIGINTAIISRSGGSQGIGFAIPSNTVRMALESLLKQGRIIRGYLGIETRAPQSGPFGGSPAESGVVVAAVMPNSPAAEAQIQRGDVIQKFDGHDIHNIAELQRLVSQVDLDKKVALEVTRNGKPVAVSAKIKEKPTNYPLARALPPGSPGQQLPPSPNEPDTEGPDEDQPAAPDGGALGEIAVRELSPQLAQTLGVPSSVRGVVVTRVDGGNGAAELRAGDVIEAINQEPVASVRDYEAAMQGLDPSQPQVLSVCRQRSRSFVVVKPR